MKADDKKKMKKKKPSAFARLNDFYSKVDSVVSVKFLSGLCIGLVSLLLRNSFSSSITPATEVAAEWFYIQGVGKVRVKVLPSMFLLLVSFRTRTLRCEDLARGITLAEHQDVAGKVNCTNYFHPKTSVVVEIGHGSGGGVAYRPTRNSNVR
jgi:hypothetical protein